MILFEDAFDMLQQAVAEVIVEVAIDTVNVIGIILSVVVFNQERRALDEIVVWLTGFQTAGPDKMDLLHAGSVDAGKVLIRKFLANASDMLTHEFHENLTLIERHR
jgi:hypothetical protein